MKKMTIKEHLELNGIYFEDHGTQLWVQCVAEDCAKVATWDRSLIIEVPKRKYFCNGHYHIPSHGDIEDIIIGYWKKEPVLLIMPECRGQYDWN